MTSSDITQLQAMRYARQILLPGFDLDKQEKLLGSKVLQIGAGGLGCASAQYLVAAGVGSLTLVDDDVVELTNLQRQVLHGEVDIGKSKCVSAKASLSLLNSQCNIDVIERRLNLAELKVMVAQHDLVLDCTDNLASRNDINNACIAARKALVSGAAIRMEGQVICFKPTASEPCYQCLSALFKEQNLSCVEAGIMSPVVGVIGAMQALEAIKLLTQYGESLTSRLLLFDAMTSRWQEFNLAKDPNCPSCTGL
jgi:molybdopterin-synthase adenylyltransferase